MLETMGMINAREQYCLPIFTANLRWESDFISWFFLEIKFQTDYIIYILINYWRITYIDIHIKRQADNKILLKIEPEESQDSYLDQGSQEIFYWIIHKIGG